MGLSNQHTLLLYALPLVLWILTLQPRSLQPLTLLPLTLQPFTLQPITLQSPSLLPLTLQPRSLIPLYALDFVVFACDWAAPTTLLTCVVPTTLLTCVVVLELRFQVQILLRDLLCARRSLQSL
jgi:hypothetical protein